MCIGAKQDICWRWTGCIVEVNRMYIGVDRIIGVDMGVERMYIFGVDGVLAVDRMYIGGKQDIDCGRPGVYWR